MTPRYFDDYGILHITRRHVRIDPIQCVNMAAYTLAVAAYVNMQVSIYRPTCIGLHVLAIATLCKASPCVTV